MLQKSYHPGLAILRWYSLVWNLYAQNDQFLYDSIVHLYYKGGTDEQAVVYLKAVLKSRNDIPCPLYEPRWTMHRQVRTVYSRYMQCIYHVQTRIYITECIVSAHTMFKHVYTQKNLYAHAYLCAYLFRQCNVICKISQFYEHKNQEVKFC